MSSHPITIGVFVLYLAILLVIGFISSKQAKGGINDFFLAGRNLNKWTVALSAVSSGRSAWLILGLTGTAYATGLNAVWAIAGYITVEIFLFFFVARRFRKYSEKYDSITVPDILATRYNDKNNLLRLVSSLIIIFFMVAYVGSQVVAGSTAFSSSLGVSPGVGMGMTALIILIYVMLGGFHAVSKTDVLQCGFMFGALIILPILAIINLGGFGPILDTLHSQGGGFTSPFAFTVGAIGGLLGIGLGSPGNPHIIVRYMSLKNLKEMKQAALIASFWNVLMGWGAIFIGLAGRAMFPDISMLPNENQEAIFSSVGNEILDPFTMGILLVAILASIMSSADSQLLVGASAIVRDIYDRIIGKGKEISQKQLVFYSRVSTVVLMSLSVLLAISAQEFVFWMVLFAFGGLGACFGPALLLTFYWKGTTKHGVFWGMIVGLITVILVKQQPAWTFAFLPDIQALFSNILFGITYEAVPGFLMSLIVTVVISKFTQKPINADEVVEDLSY
ncbi:sodium/proline symporter [Alteribacillus sp. JSM 102045]|uniref:sodium/proline symporter n=1 Tax=Alteribacillus sp. JSM 102045 TaxID=1562101 RepID=UPI0035C0A603